VWLDEHGAGASADRLHALQAHRADEMAAQPNAPASKVLKTWVARRCAGTVPVMIAAGLPIGAAATIGGVRGFAQLGARVPLSPLLRRLGAHQTIVVSFLTGGIGTLFLLASGHVAPASACSILAGASIGAMYTLQGIYTNELVGQENPERC
jgi:hypothetical protein